MGGGSGESALEGALGGMVLEDGGGGGELDEYRAVLG